VFCTPLELLQYRGLTRNGALLRCQTEWLLFADCDMVYHPHFFKWLANEMANMDDDKLDHIFISGRDSNTISKANAIVGAEDYSAVIPNPWKRADRRLDKIPRSCVGAGYFQLINVDRCEHDNYYVDPERNKDKSWIDAYAKASSDYQFRRRVGKTHRLPRWFWRSQIHLNHNRDNMFKKHLVEQR
jgi:hypothetical protein